MAMSTSQPAVFRAIMAAITILFLTASYSAFSSNNLSNNSVASLTSNTGKSRPSFLEIASKHGTDKVTTHAYNHMYNKYLEPLRDQPLKMLEIGLGCDMNYGPGKSYFTWLEYLPNVELYYIEYDAACAEKWRSKTSGAKIFAGDQADTVFLKRFVEESGGNFDIIIDDGGHTMKQQLTSFDFLFKEIKPGGIYFCEDLHTSYWSGYGGGEKLPGTMMERIKTDMDDMMLARPQTENMKHIWSIDCMKEVCAFSKKLLGVAYGDATPGQ